MDTPEPDQQALAQYLRFLQSWGVSFLPRAGVPALASFASAENRTVPGQRRKRSTPTKEVAVGKPPLSRQATSQAHTPAQKASVQLSLLGEPPPGAEGGGPWQQPPHPPEKRQQALQALAREIARCTRCPEPVATRTQTVPGVGNPGARLCFLGEAPGADEDRLGEPFVGRAGQLLNRIIQACGMKREEVYIFNVLKCRPPGNRTPTETEAANCWPFLMRQIEIIRPEFICCLGAVAARTLLKTKAPMSRLRGKVHLFQGIKVVVTYHPAYLLRNPSAKRQTWEDMKLLLREMGLPVPERKES